MRQCEPVLRIFSVMKSVMKRCNTSTPTCSVKEVGDDLEGIALVHKKLLALGREKHLLCVLWGPGSTAQPAVLQTAPIPGMRMVPACAIGFANEAETLWDQQI